VLGHQEEHWSFIEHVTETRSEWLITCCFVGMRSFN